VSWIDPGLHNVLGLQKDATVGAQPSPQPSRPSSQVINTRLPSKAHWVVVLIDVKV